MNFSGVEIRRVFKTLFPEKLEPDEYIEIPYGSKDHPWTKALHIKDVDELLDWLYKRPQEPLHIGIHWTTKLITDPLRLNKRTNENHVYRAWGIILDIEKKATHGLLEPKEATKLWNKSAFPTLPDQLRNAIEFVAYTGGGLQGYLRFSRTMTRSDLILLNYGGEQQPGAVILDLDRNYKRAVRALPYLDLSSFSISHGQRLIGIPSAKYDRLDTCVIVEKDITLSSNPTPADLDEILEQYKIYSESVQLERDKARKKRIDKMISGNVDNFEAVRQLARIIDIFGLEHKKNGTTSTSCRCPLHEDGKNFGAVVYHNSDGDFFKCFHENWSGDAVALYQKIHNCDKFEALQKVADLSGIELERINPEQKEELKEDPEVYARKKFELWLINNKALPNEATVQRLDTGLVITIPVIAHREKKELKITKKDLQAAKFFDAALEQLYISMIPYPDKKYFGYAAQSWFAHKVHTTAETSEVERIITEDDIKIEMGIEFNDAIMSAPRISYEDIASLQTESKNADAEDFVEFKSSLIVYETDTMIQLNAQTLLRKLKSQNADWGMKYLIQHLRSNQYKPERLRIAGTQLRIWRKTK